MRPKNNPIGATDAITSNNKKRFIPHDRGRVVSIFLENYFNKYVEYDFTADLENQLDEISDGKLKWKEVIKNF